jgi:hypothetical protein
MHEKFDHNTHWVSQHIENGLFGIENPVLVSILKFSTPWNLLALAFTVLHWESISFSFIYASAFGLFWVNIAPFLIWYYDERVLPEFFAHLSELISDPEERHQLAEKYNDFFAQHRISVSLFWGGALTAIVFVSESALRAQGMTGGGELFLWTTYAYAAYIGSVLGHGFVGPLTTILLIREVTQYELEIDPLHPDNLGGLSTVGYVSIRTTLLYSSASLFLPLLFYFSSSGGISWVIFGFTGIYVLSIFISFIYPTTIVNRRAQEYRDSILEDLRQQYSELERATNSPEENEIAELNKRLELQRLQRRYENYNSVNLYPFQLGTLTRLAGSVILPILFMVIELYLPNLI